MNRGDMIYKYPLFSLKHFLTFVKYSKKTARELCLNGWGNNRFFIILDMIWSNIRYGACDTRDYILFEFYRKSGKERSKYFTKRRYFKFIKTFDKETFYRLIEKPLMYKEYAQFLNRDVLYVNALVNDEKIIDFFDKHQEVIMKPVSSEQGMGVCKVFSNDIGKLLSEKGKRFILEEAVKNCIEFEELNPSSLNTLRVFTVNEKGKCEIIAMMLRCGINGSVVDNWGAGGVVYPIDLKYGIVEGKGVDKKGNKYIYHPGTNKIMLGLQIPRFDDLCKYALQIAGYNANVKYAGLDIAITPTSFTLIEVNFPGGHDILQCFGNGLYDKIRPLY